MKCPKCLFENPDDTNYCGKCGAEIVTFQSKTLPIKPEDQHRFSSQDLSIGSLFAGRYQIIEEIGTGGMGTVYKAFDNKIREKVALKLLKPEIAADETTIERFHHELKITRKIIHKNVCHMYHISQEEDTHYIIMEYIQGEDLKSTIRKMGRLTVGKTLDIAKQICEGLREAHKIGVVHRDLKPQNIMINEKGDAQIMDFGIARSLKSGDFTRTGMVIGTPHYMSPEQIEGQKVDQRTDIYALGIILYEMLTGDFPFEGDTALSIGIQKKTESPKDPKSLNPQIPVPLSRLILQCLEKDPERRIQTVEEAQKALARIEEVLPTTEKSRIMTRIQPRKIRVPIKKKWMAAFLIAVVVMLASYFLVTKIFISPEVYDNFVLVDLYTDESLDLDKNIIEYLLMRSLAASTRLNVYVESDYIIYKQKTEVANQELRKPLITVHCDVRPKITGYEFLLTVKSRRESYEERFECKGPYDLIIHTIDEIHGFIAEKSDGKISSIEGGRKISQICTENFDALKHFIQGEGAWNKLDTRTARNEFEIAVENDPDFSLARLRFADVLYFRGDRPEAKENLVQAMEKKEKLVRFDVLRLNALLARIDDQKNKERQYLGRLTEAFPFKKEYHYEYAESYFHVGNPDEAIPHYEEALELDPTYSLAYNHMAFCYSWLGEHERALQHFQKYVDMDNTANSYDSLATGYMFAGEYEKALEVLSRGKKLKPVPYYLYGNIARNNCFKGKLAEAEKNYREQAVVDDRDITRMNVAFSLAYLDYMRSDKEKAFLELKPVRDFYSKELYKQRIDEGPNLAFWLTGVIAAEKKQLKELTDMIHLMEQKIAEKNVNAINFFPVYKLYLHLKILEGQLKGDTALVVHNITEGKRIKKKMGFWNSMFNLPFFLNAYAESLLAFGRKNEAFDLLNEALAYNPNLAASRLTLARIYLMDSNREMAEKECLKAEELLSDADDNFILLDTLKKLKADIHGEK
ncbi:MAG: protein kinase [Candidatus Aminicenantes bacterium]|jgi:serine/threonine-protein kinase